MGCIKNSNSAGGGLRLCDNKEVAERLRGRFSIAISTRHLVLMCKCINYNNTKILRKVMEIWEHLMSYTLRQNLNIRSG